MSMPPCAVQSHLQYSYTRATQPHRHTDTRTATPSLSQSAKNLSFLAYCSDAK